MPQDDSSRTYHQVKHRLFFIGLFLDIAVLLFIFLTGLTFFLKGIPSKFSSNPIFINGVYIFLFSTLMYCVHFPLSVFSGFFWEHKFNLSNQKFPAWLKDNLKKSLLGFLIALILLEVVYALLGRFPNRWWIGAGIFWLLLSFVLAKLTPDVIIPLFYKYIPLENQDLKDRIKELFKSCRVVLKDVCAMDLSTKTKKANAFFCGLGKNRRVVLSDTLISQFSPTEIEVVVAHELGHYKHKDIIKILMAQSLIIFIGFYLIHQFLLYALGQFGLTRIDDIAFLPILILAFMMFSLITTPLLNWYSRVIETEADRFSIEKTKNPKDFISLMEKLGEINLADDRPGLLTEIFFHDHPPLYKRIKFATRYL